jgi:hypothetical protein
MDAKARTKYKQAWMLHDEAGLALPFQVLTGKDPNRHSKTAMIAALAKSIPWSFMRTHEAYLKGLTAAHEHTIQFYRDHGSELMNDYIPAQQFDHGVPALNQEAHPGDRADAVTSTDRGDPGR